MIDLEGLGGKIGATPVTRFAPGPTGHLHLGHVVNAIFVWGVARALGGQVLVRIEDVDRSRSRPEYELSILHDLNWLGLAAGDRGDRGDRGDGGAGVAFTRQSDRTRTYERALAHVISVAHVYGCRCSRKAISLVSPAGPDEEARYPGTCRDLALPLGEETGVRVELPEEAVEFVDALTGPQRQEPWRQCGDPLVRDRLGQWTYQFAVAVDDFDQGVNLVIRGRDILPSTGRQILLARMLGRQTPPVFLHHPLVVDETGRKLSKRDDARAVRDLRRSGWSPARVLGEAAALAGLTAGPVEVEADQLATLFRRST